MIIIYSKKEFIQIWATFDFYTDEIIETSTNKLLPAQILIYFV